MKIIGIMACDPSGVVGFRNALPWHYPEDLAHFRMLTDQQIIVMGRKTFEGLPKRVLKNRRSIVFSRTMFGVQNDFRDVQFVSSFEEFLHLPALQNETVYFIGGAMLAKEFLSAEWIDEFFLTKIHQAYKGDAFLDLDFFKNWPCILIKETQALSFYHYLNPSRKR